MKRKSEIDKRLKRLEKRLKNPLLGRASRHTIRTKIIELKRVLR